MPDTARINEVALDLLSDQASPAGPLYASGQYAEADMIIAAIRTDQCGTVCSGSWPYSCC